MSEKTCEMAKTSGDYLTAAIKAIREFRNAIVDDDPSDYGQGLVEGQRIACRCIEDKITALIRTELNEARASPKAESLLRELCACFGSFDRPLSKSLQGWDYPRLHRVREKAMAFLDSKSEAGHE